MPDCRHVETLRRCRLIVGRAKLAPESLEEGDRTWADGLVNLKALGVAEVYALAARAQSCN